MTAISAAYAGNSSVLSTASIASSAGVVAAASPTSTPSAPQPAVTSSFSTLATSAASAASSSANIQPTTISATAGQVTKALQAVEELDFNMFAYNHTDWNALYEEDGEQAVKNLQSCYDKEIKNDIAAVTEANGDIGIPIISNITDPLTETSESGVSSGNSNTLSDAIITGTLTLEPFNFSSDGSTYSVTTNTAGQIVGTKGSQAWETWGIPASNSPSTSYELAALLASFEATDAATGSPTEAANTTNASVNISA